MTPKKGKSRGRLPHIDRSKALPVRSEIGFWKVLALGAIVGAIVYSCDKAESPVVEPIQTTQEVTK